MNYKILQNTEPEISNLTLKDVPAGSIAFVLENAKFPKVYQGTYFLVINSGTLPSEKFYISLSYAHYLSEPSMGNYKNLEVRLLEEGEEIVIKGQK
mgnify:CR=1 FL=1